MSDLHATLQDGVVSIRRENKSKVEAKRVAVLVASKNVAAKYAGRNFSNMSYKSWLGIQQATQAAWRGKKADVTDKLGTSLGSSVESFGQNEDEFEKARQQMMRSDGRDVLEESTIAEAARQERETGQPQSYWAFA